MNLVYTLNRLGSRWYRKKIFRRAQQNKSVPAPSYILWDCTRRCNLNCEHCGAIKESYDRELSSDEIRKVIVDLAGMKTRMFAVTGGEPFLRNDLLDILSFAHLKGLKTGIATNGYFIDKTVAKQIKNAGVDSVQISIDGLQHTHNKIRGNNQSFKRAFQAIQLLQEINVPSLWVATTLTKSNYAELEKLRDLLVEHHVKTWRISLIMPIGRAEETNRFVLHSSELNHFLNFVLENTKPIDILVAENMPFLAQYEEKIRNEPLLCPVGLTACCIGVNGNVRGCAEQPDIPNFIEGNITNDSIINIWQKGFKKYRLNESMQNDDRCRQCKDRYSCYGGCHVMRLGNLQCIHDFL